MDKKEIAENAVKAIRGQTTVSTQKYVAVDEKGRFMFVPQNPNPHDVKDLTVFSVLYRNGAFETRLV